VVLDPTPREARAPESLEVFDAAPDRDHQVIAHWELRHDGPGDESERLRRRATEMAARLGADALTIETRSGPGEPVHTPVDDQEWRVTPTARIRLLCRALAWR
jgi:sugar phosphate isomerase/epimerase